MHIQSNLHKAFDRVDQAVFNLIDELIKEREFDDAEEFSCDLAAHMKEIIKGYTRKSMD